MATKIGPKEAQNRLMREQRIATNKRLIDEAVKTKARIIGKIGHLKISNVKVGNKTLKRGGRGR
jgi:hypothetical protein